MNRATYLPLIAIVLCCVYQALIAQDVVKQPSSKEGDESCKNQKVNLTGTYKGALFTRKDQKEGAPGTIRVKGNWFELSSGILQGAGLISAVNNCGDVSIALKFVEATDEHGTDVTEFMKNSVSLDVRRLREQGIEFYSAEPPIDKPIIWATATDKSGKLAGADIAFVICPEHPKCKRYPSCPCPEPPRNKP